MSAHREAYLAELRKLLEERPDQPRVVYDQKMPPYHFQTPDYGGGWASSNGTGGMYRDPRKKTAP